MLSRLHPKDVIHIVLNHHTGRRGVSVLIVLLLTLIAIGLTAAVLHYGEMIASSPGEPVGKAVRTDPPKKTNVKPAEQPQPMKHDYVIPPVINGVPPVITNFHTVNPVVFLTIDDGAFKDASVVQMIKDNHIKASLFLAKTFISNNPNFFKQITDLGSLIEDHTISHDTNMGKDMTYQQQKDEICGMADYEAQIYGRRPIFFRPPGGAYSATMLQAAGACGMRAVVTWIAKANGGSMQYQIGDHLRPGDVVLMHFRPEFKQDMQAFINAQNAAGLHTELLEDWIN